MISRRLNITSLGLLLTIVAGGVGLILLLSSLQEELAIQRRIFREDRVWLAGQLEREARMFRHAVLIYSEGNNSVSHEEMNQLFDVLWSRIESMDKGQLGQMYLQLEGSAEALQYGRTMLHDLEPEVAKLQPGDRSTRDRILNQVDQAVEQFYQIARRSSALNLKQQEARRRNFEQTSSRAMSMVLVIFVSGGILVILLTIKQRAINRLTQTLEDKVRDRTRKLEESNERLLMLSVAIEQSPASVIICNCDGFIEYVNPRFEQVSGYKAHDVIGRNPRFLQSGRTTDSTYEEMWSTVRAGHEWQGQICNQRPNGDLYWEQMSLTPIKDTSGATIRYLAVKEDITQRRQYEEQLLRQANFDSLTGLPNRMLAIDRLNQVLRQARRRNASAGLMFVDLDHFKRINDTLGHEAGDQLLREASQRLSGCLREGDTAARFGGDEFIVILPELSSTDDAHHILRRIIEAFSQPFMIAGTEIFTSTSIGIALYPGDGDSPALLLRNADAAMYQAKAAGRNTYRFFVHEMNEQAQLRARIEHHLRTAHERNELQLRLQPIVDTETGRLAGAEALLYWLSPELGEVPPKTFIPIAEESGLIVDIGNWALLEACREAKRWQNATGTLIDICINIAGRQFRDEDFPKTVRKVLATTDITPSRICLEITENTLMEDEHHARKIIEQLVQMDLRIALDDFGTGYSALSYLGKFHIDTLKIDGSFLKNVLPDSNEATLAAAILSLGRSLQLNMVGEGVETLEQLNFLRAHGCPMCQGYYFSKPLPVAEFEELVTTWETTLSSKIG
ncbi:putative bifunctional diguanylate cyclase/phosphodiesterase [Desulfopila aestuarii]|uniref:PAS domain S-box-containing protein/diguanylate cyclase (GGDEF) domain-containing protein n=1 Tax=Desulfopila aestuarii DSM 18488 TaxID=1121416 RepID=A0A1M7XWN3_9BACT|nr:EAL domain-containing protein [Desulfopila aestuarii]SHO43185.1 PAS domain S-box-containing protein/diguanylate cyclase (GGDEF) domain-containing protein [Desulfopila aestuarii DSM 18488]